MSEDDPHIHVEQKVMQSGAAFRNLVVSAVGRAIDVPSVVTTGCGLQVPYVMTSPRPECVTCLGCRDHAYSEYLRFADQVERLGRMPGAPISRDQAAKATERLRDLAHKFSD